MHLSIIGSCLLRDIFNSKFVTNHAEYFKVDSYFARTTIPSIMSGAYEYDIEILEKKFNALKFEYHYTECAKCMLSILENNDSDYLLLDFYADSYYGTFECEGNYYSGWSFNRLIKQGVIDKSTKYKKYNFVHNPEEYFEIWCKSFDKFMEYAKLHFPNTKIVINGIKGSNQITENQEVIGIQQPKLSIDALNTLWKKMDDYCEKKHGIPVIRYAEEYTLNPNYIYGLNNEFVHFHPEYYTDAFSKILELCTEGHERKDAHINLVRNSNFEMGTRFWSLSNSNWEVKQTDEKKVLIPQGASKAPWKSIWCDPIEINGDKEIAYTLSFTVKRNEEVDDTEVVLFGIRTFKRAVSQKYQEAIYSDLVSIPKEEIPLGKEVRISYTFKPAGKFIRIAPHVRSSIFDIEFSNIQLERGTTETEYKQCADDKNVKKI